MPRKLDESQLQQVSEELRAETISAVSATGGHLGAAKVADLQDGRFEFDQVLPAVLEFFKTAGIEVPMWGALIWLGVLGSFVPMAFSYLALRHLSATVVGIIATSETVLAFGFALAWLGELITLTQALGGIVVVIGILIAQTARKQSSEKVVEI